MAVNSAHVSAEAVGEQRENDVARIEPTLGDAVIADSRKYHRNQKAEPSTSKEQSPDPLDEGEEGRSRFGLVAGVLIAAGLLGGSGYLLYKNLDTIVAPDQGGDAASAVRDKSPVEDPVASGSDEIVGKPVRTVTVAPPADSGDAGTDGATDEPASGRDEGQVETGPVDNPPEEIQQATQSETETLDLSAPQQSILYEEEGPNGEPGSANVGAVTWTLEGEGNDAAIVASADITDQQSTFTIRISKNSDAELPASHLIELSVLRAEDDPNRSIASIPGLILKPTEQSRGEGLIGAAIRISDDLHWIALTAGDRETKYNMELLSLRSWIDIPIQYSNGRRAILTLEKGAAGDAVVNGALAGWDN